MTKVQREQLAAMVTDRDSLIAIIAELGRITFNKDGECIKAARTAAGAELAQVYNDARFWQYGTAVMISTVNVLERQPRPKVTKQ